MQICILFKNYKIAVNLYDGVLTVIVSYNSVKIGLIYLYMFICTCDTVYQYET